MLSQVPLYQSTQIPSYRGKVDPMVYLIRAVVPALPVFPSTGFRNDNYKQEQLTVIMAFCNKRGDIRYSLKYITPATCERRPHARR